MSGERLESVRRVFGGSERGPKSVWKVSERCLMGVCREGIKKVKKG